MRNLKKVLALVLALMMALSLMVTVSATTYNDAADIEQTEAVDVMSALGVFNGTNGGNFDPDGNLTRAQAAKIITYMLLSKDVADALPNTGSKFADCADGRWYVGAVNYLTDLGIVAGRSATTFDPNGNVTGYEFAKMLLGALGYNSKTERFEGDSSWAINIAATARRAGLDKDMTTSTVTSAALTREQACQLAFNTLTCNMVYYEGGTEITSNGSTVVVNPSRRTMENNTGVDYRVVTGDQDTWMQFCEMYFQTLKFDKNFSDSDDFGRSLAKCWTVDDDPAYMGAAEPALVITTKMDEAAVTKATKGIVKTFTSTLDATIKGAVDTSTDAGSASDIAALTGQGKVVEIYTDAEGATTAVVVVEYKLGTLKSVTEKNGKTTYAFTGTGLATSKTNDEENTNCVLEGNIEAGDTVTVAEGKDGVYHVYPTTTFTGNQTAVSTKGDVITITVGGSKYVVGKGVANVDTTKFTNSADSATYYVDVNGYVVKVEGAAAADPEYAVILNAVASKSTSLDSIGYTASVRAVLADGSVADFDLVLHMGDTEKSETATSLYCGDVELAATAANDANLSNTVADALSGKLMSYTLNDDGQMTLAEIDEAGTSMTKGDVASLVMAAYKGETSILGDDTQSDVTGLFTKDTVFVLYNKDASGKWTAETFKGTSGLKVDLEAGKCQAVITALGSDSGAASVVFMEGETETPDSGNYVFVDNSTTNSVLKDGKSMYQYTGIAPDGTEVEVFSAAALAKSGIYGYDEANKVSAESLKADTVMTAASGEVAKTDEKFPFYRIEGAEVVVNLLKIGDSQVSMNDDTQVVYLDGDELAGANCIVVLTADASAVATIYVYEAPAADEDEGDGPAPAACTHENKTWAKATTPDSENSISIGDHVQTCDDCNEVIAHHAAPTCSAGAGTDHSSGSTVSCGSCTLTETCTTNHQ